MKYNEEVSMTYNNYTCKVTINITDDAVNVCISCLGESVLPSNTCLLSITIRKDTPGVAVMSDFYHIILKGGNGTSKVSPKLKGAIYAVLCMLLKEAVSKGIMELSDQIIVLSNEFRDPLVERFYERIGFSYDARLQRFRGSVQQVFGVCQANEHMISQELLRVVQQC
jgi:hypothetical protein